jgi:hypothetical protein
LFEEFMGKLYRYAQLFEGEHLKVVTSIFWIKLTEFDHSLK